MLKSLSYGIGVTLIIIGSIWFRGTFSVQGHIYSILTACLGALILWLGNKEFFDKDTEKNKNDKNT